MVVPLRDGHPAVAALIAEFARRYGNPKTRVQFVAELTDLFERFRRDHPRLLTEADVLAWAGQRHLANNTKRNRLSRVCTFLRWCVRAGEGDGALVEAFRDNPLRRVPRLYGKVQGTYPARWLTYDEAFGTLVAACRDRAPPPASETNSSSASDSQDSVPPRSFASGLAIFTWTTIRRRSHGSAKPAAPAASFPALNYSCCSRTTRATTPTTSVDRSNQLIRSSAERSWEQERGLSWGNPIAQICSVQRIVRRRALEARLGHLSPHDLRRSAAGILHHSTDEHGAHHFDLLDIQKVLDHTDPATTMRSYLDPMDTTAKERAAGYLD